MTPTTDQNTDRSAAAQTLLRGAVRSVAQATAEYIAEKGMARYPVDLYRDRESVVDAIEAATFGHLEEEREGPLFDVLAALERDDLASFLGDLSRAVDVMKSAPNGSTILAVGEQLLVTERSRDELAWWWAMAQPAGDGVFEHHDASRFPGLFLERAEAMRYPSARRVWAAMSYDQRKALTTTWVNELAVGDGMVGTLAVADLLDLVVGELRILPPEDWSAPEAES